MNRYTIRQTICAFSVCFLTSFLSGADLPQGFAELLIAAHLDPTALTIAEDGRIFITEKNGRILVVEHDQLLDEPLMVLEVDNYNERGLSGIALHPDFIENGYFYVYYTVKNENHNRVSRFQADGNQVIPGSEEVMIEIDSLRGTIHNAGSMAFGPDGKLYISIGDGSNGEAPQLLNSLLGKILRINDDGTIPEDNPYYTSTEGIYRSIFALGFRNSFSMAIQPGTGRIFATDVGSYAWEEVNEILPGKNYGWATLEGPLQGQNPPEHYMDPVYAYPHSEGCAAICATFYNPLNVLFPAEYVGKFFYADYCQGYIKYLDPESPSMPSIFATGVARPVNMIVSPDGAIYYLARAGIGGGSEIDNTASTNGTLWKIFFNPTGAPFVAVNPASILVSVGEDAAFMTEVKGTQPLYYQWQKDEVDIPGASMPSYSLQNAALIDSGTVFRCIITNLNGADTTAGAILGVTSNQRPEPLILLPEAGHRYRGGETLVFEGQAMDNEQGELAPEAMRWRIDFHHNVHTHPALAPTSGISDGSYYIPQVGETATDVWYRIHFNVEDAGGLSNTVSRDIFPLRTIYHVRSVPNGLPVYADNTLGYTPITRPSVVGILRTLDARSVIRDDSLLIFKNWEHGPEEHFLAFAAAEDTLTYTAIYESVPRGNGTGLTGYYYPGQPWDPTFYEPYAFTRIDETIDFDFGDGSPDADLLGNDFWLVRWEGYLLPFIDDLYGFHVTSDDGARLWVNDQLVIDAWDYQSPTEHNGSIWLEGGTYYPIRLEYFEAAGGASCRMAWSSTKLEKHIVQRSQLFPELPVGVHNPDHPMLRIYPNPATDRLIATLDTPSEGTFEVLNSLGVILIRQPQQGIGAVIIDISKLAAGAYWLRYTNQQGRLSVQPFLKD